LEQHERLRCQEYRSWVFPKIEIAEGVLQLQGKEVWFQRQEVEWELRDADLSQDAFIFQDLLGDERPPRYPEDGEVMLGLLVLLKLLDLRWFSSE
jgi:hypothetical protein